mmetsp:Transcript_3062/g.4116  ORF Transcript_3062/g.4116 Transcript_3062/m.4116 type:complete len:234 (-) Transcript_3062:1057-1758(-)
MIICNQVNLAKNLSINRNSLFHCRAFHQRTNVRGTKRKSNNAKVFTNANWLANETLVLSNFDLFLGEAFQLGGDILSEENVELPKHNSIKRGAFLGAHFHINYRIVSFKNAHSRELSFDCCAHRFTPLVDEVPGLGRVASGCKVGLHLLNGCQPPQRQPTVLHHRQLCLEVGEGVGEVVAREVVLQHIRHPHIGGGHSLQASHHLGRNQQGAGERGSRKLLGSCDSNECVLAK